MKKRFGKKLNLNKLSVTRLNNIEIGSAKAGVAFQNTDLKGASLPYCFEDTKLQGLISITGGEYGPHVCDESVAV